MAYFNDIREWAYEVGNNEWHLRFDQEPRITDTVADLSGIGHFELFSALHDLVIKTEGREEAETFRRTVETLKQQSWRRHENGTQDCIECEARRRAAIAAKLRRRNFHP